MYEARQNKEKVSRRIDGDGIQQKRQMNNKPKYIHNGIIQLMLTRSQIPHITNEIAKGNDQLDNYNYFDRILIAEYARDLGFDISECGLGLLRCIDSRDFRAEDNSDIDHPNTANAPEYEYVSPVEALQLRRGPGLSGPRTIAPFFRNGYYMRDHYGNIDFDQIYQCDSNFQSPVQPDSLVDLEEGSCYEDYGVLLNGNIVHIPSASRSQHFSIANRVARRHGQISGNGGNSPFGLTWHHLIDKYKMVLVNRNVHQRFGHNGGYYFW